jgi:hypothetical protein
MPSNFKVAPIGIERLGDIQLLIGNDNLFAPQIKFKCDISLSGFIATLTVPAKAVD